jgi:RNA 3'-terminal phosphate cyclase (ATP)
VEATTVPTLFFSLGERGKPAEKVADEAVSDVDAFLKSTAAVDPHSADQILLPLALAEGASEYTVSEVTQHLLTNAVIIQKFIERAIIVEGEEGSPGLVRLP